MENKKDPLVELLRDDALGHRPVFSPALFEKTVHKIRAGNTSAPRPPFIRWRVGAVAALVSISIMAGFRMLHRQPKPNPVAVWKQPQVQIPRTTDLAAENVPTEFRIRGIVSASVWPPQIRIELPASLAVSELPADQPVLASEGLPQLFLGALQRQVNGANDALVDEIPVSLRNLLGVPPAQRNDEDFR